MTGKGQKHSFANGPPRRARAQWRMAHPDNAFLANYQFLARYNRSMNGRLFDACEQLSDADRRLDRGAFFGSITASLNHLLWTDRMWLCRFAAQSVAFPALAAPGLLYLPAGAARSRRCSRRPASTWG